MEVLTMVQNIGNQVLKFDKGISRVVIIDDEGNVIESVYREGLGSPEQVMKQEMLRLVILWDLVEELGKNLGSPKRILIHFELVDMILFKLRNLFIGLNVDKNVESDDLVKRLISNFSTHFI